jgi:predicted Zn-dependent protease with MMP-like domain/HEPN domain-containing protein
MSFHLSAKEFERVAHETLKDIPEEFKPYMQGMKLVVEDYPDDVSMVEWGVKPPHYPFGCYDGPSLPEIHGARHEFAGTMTLFRRPLEEWCGNEAELRDQIERTVYHELGHRFGFKEEDMPPTLQGTAGFDVREDYSAESERRLVQARADHAAARVLLAAKAPDWALTASLSAMALALEAFLLKKSVEPGEFSTSSLTYLVLRCEEFDEAFSVFREVDSFEQLSCELGDEDVPPPCRRIAESDARDAVELAARILEKSLD